MIRFRPSVELREHTAVGGSAAAYGWPLPNPDLSQFSHGLTGRCWTMASMLDTRQDADLRIRIPAH